MIDGPGGIDNSVGAVTQGTRNVVQDFSSLNYSAAVENGGLSVLFRLSGYNGEADDDEVIVEVFAAAPFNSFDGEIKPKWDGEDVWPVASYSLERPFDPDPMSRPKFHDDHAYVVNGKLVTQLAAANLRLRSGLATIGYVNMSLKLTGAVSVCDIVPTDVGCGFKGTNCVLAGRWNANHLLRQLSQFPDPAPTNGRPFGGPLCMDAASYDTFKKSICRAVDIFDGVATAGTVCNSLSYGVRWWAEPAIIGDVYYTDPIEPRCLEFDPEIDPSNDCCERLEDPNATCPVLDVNGDD